MLSNLWVTIQNRTQQLCAFLAFFLNFCLILLIVYKSNKKLGTYKHLMLAFSVFEILYSVLDIVLEPTHFSHGTIFIVIVTTSDSLLPAEILLFLDGCYAGFFGSSLALFSVHYVYRYLVSIGSDLLSTFASWKITLWFLIPLFYGIHWTYVAWIMCPPRNMTIEYVRDAVLETFELQPDEYVFVGPYVYKIDEEGNYDLYIPDLIGAFSLSISIASSIFMILYFGIRCYRNLMKITVDVQSRHTKALQTQLFYALVIQTAIPIILMHIPSGIVFAAAFLNVTLGSLTGVMCITVALFPAIDPLPTMFIIEEYRKAVFQFLHLPSPCSNLQRVQTTDNTTGVSLQTLQN